MDYRAICIDNMSSSKYKGKTIDQLKELFNAESTEDFKALVKNLNELEEEFILVRDYRERYFLAEKVGYIKGTLKVNPKGFGFVEGEETSYYVNRDKLNYGLNNDLVVARTWDNDDGSSECEVVKILEHNTKNVIGTIKIKEGKKVFLPDSNFGERKFVISNIHDFKVINDSKVLISIDKYAKNLTAHIEKVIGYKYDPGVDILSVLYEHNIQPEFSEAVNEELKKIPDHVRAEDKLYREDLTGISTITIDGEDARDLDDAISIEKIEGGYRLGVHIADVSYYVREGMEINTEAYERGTSVYVADRVVPMLPHYLSNGVCSLNPKVERCTLTCMMDISHSGEMMTYKIFPSLIKTIERMTYTAVNEMIDENKETLNKYPHLLDMVNNMVALSRIIRIRREGMGSIDFDTREGKIILDDKGKPIDVVLRERGQAERIIEDFMIQANECVATHVKWLEYPSIYRIHEQPDAKKMRDFAKTSLILGYKFKGNVLDVKPSQCQKMLLEAKGTPEYPVLSTTLLRCMAKARYDRKCLGHFGLGLNEYTHFTSPIRRYPDLIVHRMLRKYYFEGVEDLKVMSNDEQWIEKAAIHSSEMERNAVDAERDVDDMKKAEYMEKHIGEVYPGVISSVTKFGVFVELENTVEGLVHVSNMDDHFVYDEASKSLIGQNSQEILRMGKSVRVKVIDASRFKKQVDFIILADKKGKRKRS